MRITSCALAQSPTPPYSYNNTIIRLRHANTTTNNDIIPRTINNYTLNPTPTQEQTTLKHQQHNSKPTYHTHTRELRLPPSACIAAPISLVSYYRLNPPPSDQQTKAPCATPNRAPCITHGDYPIYTIYSNSITELLQTNKNKVSERPHTKGQCATNNKGRSAKINKDHSANTNRAPRSSEVYAKTHIQYANNPIETTTANSTHQNIAKTLPLNTTANYSTATSDTSPLYANQELGTSRTSDTTSNPIIQRFYHHNLNTTTTNAVPTLTKTNKPLNYTPTQEQTTYKYNQHNPKLTCIVSHTHTRTETAP